MISIDGAKNLVNQLAHSFGYRVERIVDYGEHELSIFDVLLDHLAPPDRKLFFVQVGAHDGRTGDPIHQAVIRHHWRGLLLEPQPEVFEQLVRNYRDEPQLILENVALGDKCGTRNLFTVKGRSQLASFDRGSLAKRVRDSSRLVELPVEVCTFRSLVERHDIERVDFLLIDTEGFDYEIIKMAFDDGLPIPSLVRYEHLHLSTADRNSCAELLAVHGYRLLRDGRDTIAFRTPSR